jgi:CO/xanthine dehydrogenase Mo-binding subunit
MIKCDILYVMFFDTICTEMSYDSGYYIGLLDKVLAAADWDKLQKDLQRRRAGGETVGAGLAMFVEKSGLGPFDGVRVTVDTSGAVDLA